MKNKTILKILSALWLFTVVATAQVGSYYDGINTSSSSFVDDLKARVRSPYTKIAYDNFDETNIANYAAQSNGSGGYYVTCVYSGYQYNYTGTFTWSVLSREHTWCYSWMPAYPSTSVNEYSDQHHLFPTHQNNANGRRSNHPLGVVTTVSYQFLDGKVGTNTAGQTVYEPRDEQKGDAARALLYMALKYDDVSGYAWDFNWLNNVRLPALSEASQDLDMLLQWCVFDLPDAWEIGRNDYIQTIQKNRNPFIDHPEYINYINFNDMTYKSGVTLAVEPTNYVTNFSTGTVTANSIEVSWTDAVAGSQVPSGYLICISSSTITAPSDGVSYTDDTDLSDGSGKINITYAAADNYTISNLFGATNYSIKIYSYNGTSTTINYKTDGTVPTINTVTLTPVLAAEPSNYITNLSSANLTHSSVTLNWTAAVTGAQAPSGYLIIATASSINTPIDGTTYADDILLSDGNGFVNAASSSNSYTFSTLSPNTSYTFNVYSYNGSDESINYKTDGTVPSISVTSLDAYGTDDLIAGDILIIGFNSVDPDQFAFVPLVNLAAGTQINFTDNGWLNTGAFRGNEGIITWSAPAGGVSHGTIINFTSPATVNVGSVSSSGSFGLAQSGDQILVYTGSYGTPVFLYAVNDDGSAWQADATSSNTSALPNGLINGETAVALVEKDNGIFNGEVNPDVDQLRLTVSNPSMWTMSDEILTMPTGIWALPVELTNFSALITGNSIEINWSTSTEINNYGFEIERLIEGINVWQKIGFVPGSGNSNVVKNYSFSDSELFNSTVSYRLKQIDTDGNFKYSNVVSISRTSAVNDFVIYQNYPNP
ncbi:MAG: endonuclease, partial [Ignavibacteriaceae bacterium]|nr:endonuclease [Ignavibacteriaceae bacterium]